MHSRVLFLAPQPFFQERGTPIAVKMALEALTSAGGEQGVDAITLVTYPEGEDVQIPGVTIDRVRTPRWLHGVGPGASWRKIGCDFLLALKVFSLLWRNRKNQFALIHAIEESVFIALFAKMAFGVRYIYDMDSSLSLQLTEQWKWLRPLRSAFEFLEGIAIRHSIAVAPVCNSLQEIAVRQGARSITMLRDVSILIDDPEAPSSRTIRGEMGIPDDGLAITYVGNLEAYQGVDLLVESFAQISGSFPLARLVIVGGREQHRIELELLARKIGIDDKVTFLGPRPIKHLAAYLRASDILAAPRTRGNNTPMKVYSYLHSGRVLIATRLPTHTQVLDDEICVLVEPSPREFGAGLASLLSDAELRLRLGSSAAVRAEAQFTPAAFKEQLSILYKNVLGVSSSKSEAICSIDGKINETAS